MPRVALDRLVHDRYQIAGHVRIQPVKPFRFAGGDLLDQPVTFLLIKGGTETEHLVERQTQRVNVAACIRPAVERFGRHVAQRAQDVAGVRQVLLIVGLGQAEVGHPDHPAVSSSRFDGLMSRWSTP